MAKRLIPGFKIVPTTALVSDVLLDAIRNPDRRYVLSTPPRSGKSLLASVIGPLFALMLDPDASIIVKRYADTLALEHCGQARRLVTGHADLLGFEVDQSKSAVDRWLVAGHGGGAQRRNLVEHNRLRSVGQRCAGGRRPIKGAAEADSPAYRRRLLSAFRADLLSRLHPGASCLVVSSRWNADDLIGNLTSDDDARWCHINIPAIATAGVPDALDREPGTAVVSALGRLFVFAHSRGVVPVSSAAENRRCRMRCVGCCSAPHVDDGCRAPPASGSERPASSTAVS